METVSTATCGTPTELDIQNIPTPPEPAVQEKNNDTKCTRADTSSTCSHSATQTTPTAGPGDNGTPPVSGPSVEEINALLTEATIGAAQKLAKEGSAKQRRKEDKGIEHVLKALNSLETTEEKLAALCTKYTELLEEHRLMQNKFKQNQKKLTSLTREKDHLQNEQSKTVLAKSKLESLCRELQRHNKLIKDESVARAKEEEEKRKEVTSKFQTTINDIQRQMNENYEKNNKLRDENVELATKLKNLIEQYELREKQIEELFKHKELETQLRDAKLAQSNLQMTEEMERNFREKQKMLDDAGHSQQKIELLEAQESQLRQQVALYTEKYEEFQSTLAKSNEVFQSFKSEMDKMTKKIKKLEKETVMWRSRWENSNKALLDMAEEKTRSDKEISLLNSKVQKLESLCRALQDERKKLANKVNGTGASPATLVPEVERKEAKLLEVTKTPPNTPNAGSRGSPEPSNQRPDDTVDSPAEVNESDSTSQDADQSKTVLQPECVSDQLKAVLQQQEVSVQSEPTIQTAGSEISQSEAVVENGEEMVEK